MTRYCWFFGNSGSKDQRLKKKEKTRGMDLGEGEQIDERWMARVGRDKRGLWMRKEVLRVFVHETPEVPCATGSEKENITGLTVDCDLEQFAGPQPMNTGECLFDRPWCALSSTDRGDFNC